MLLPVRGTVVTPLGGDLTISTSMLIILQHNAAHLGIVTGLCVSEASTKFFRRGASRLTSSPGVMGKFSAPSRKKSFSGPQR
jgi:hypothetical protein